MRTLLLMCALLGAVGCADEQCADGLFPAVSVTPIDSVTGQVVTGVVASVSEGAFSDALRPNGDGVLTGGHGRPGTYTIEITAPGYEAWSQTSVGVSDSDCGGVETVHIEARLVPTA